MVIFIALGSAVGGVTRFLLGTFVQARFGAAFPVGTLLVNVSGALLLGFLFTFAIAAPSVSPEMRAPFARGSTQIAPSIVTWAFPSGRRVVPARRIATTPRWR